MQQRTPVARATSHPVGPTGLSQDLRSAPSCESQTGPERSGFVLSEDRVDCFGRIGTRYLKT
jgi:hypothetical protein